MSIPIRVVFEDHERNSATFYTTFDLGVLDPNRMRPELTQRGEKLKRAISAIPGVDSGETSVAVHNHSVWVSKFHAFKWDEIKPEVIKILKTHYNLEKIDLE